MRARSNGAGAGDRIAETVSDVAANGDLGVRKSVNETGIRRNRRNGLGKIEGGGNVGAESLTFPRFLGTVKRFDKSRVAPDVRSGFCRRGPAGREIAEAGSSRTAARGDS